MTPYVIILSLTVSVVSSSFNLTILHTNDVHARFEETNKRGGRCGPKEKLAGKCYGGVARRYTKIHQLGTLYPELLLLDAGDQYQGTLWFSHYAGKATSYFMNRLGYTAMSFGNHEFDNGVAGILGFLRNASFPILACNVDDTDEPSIQGLFSKSTVVKRGGHKIGIIGFVTKNTAIISSPGKLKFLDEVESVSKEARNLTAQGVEVIIALGHAGFRTDKNIAARVKEVDIVVGGHTNTFLYTGKAPSSETPEAEYPHVVTQASGRRVLVVQDYAFGKYLGFLQATFDNKGEIESWTGNPVLLDKNVPEDASISSEINQWKIPIENVTGEPVGRTMVLLDGDTCRTGECNMGNFVADAVLYQTRKEADSVTWADVQAALIVSGSIRTSFEPGEVTIGDVLTLNPFRNTLQIIVVKGSTLLQMLEYSVLQMEEKDGRFLQVSGIQVTYDLSRPAGRKAVAVWVACTRCKYPQFKLLDKSAEYTVVTQDFLVEGGNGYDMIKPNLIKRHLVGTLLTDAVVEYFKSRSPIMTGTDRRILFQIKDPAPVCDSSYNSANAQLILFMTLTTCLLNATLKTHALHALGI